MRNVSNAVKALPDSLAEGMNKVSDNMGRMSERLGQDIKQSILKVTPSHRASMWCPNKRKQCSVVLFFVSVKVSFFSLLVCLSVSFEPAHWAMALIS